jgi:Spy/CpxP family protein refolding chaperone
VGGQQARQQGIRNNINSQSRGTATGVVGTGGSGTTGSSGTTSTNTGTTSTGTTGSGTTGTTGTGATGTSGTAAGTVGTAGSGTAQSGDTGTANGIASATQQAASGQGTLQTQQANEQGVNTHFDNALSSTFTDPAMRQRFNQLNLQYQGVGAFADPTVQQQLNLTPQQRQQIGQLTGEWRRDFAALQGGARGNLTQQQLDELRMQFTERLSTVLTPAQLQVWEQMIGEQYNFPYTAYLNSGSRNDVRSNSGDLGSRTAGRGTAGGDQAGDGNTGQPADNVPYNRGGATGRSSTQRSGNSGNTNQGGGQGTVR